MLRTQALIVPTEFAAEPTTKMKSSKANLVAWSFRLPPKKKIDCSFELFFPFIDIWYFFSSSKLHFRNELNRFDFPPRKTPVAQKHSTISRQEKMAFSTPGRFVLGLPSPSPRVCMGERTGVRWRQNQNSRVDRLPNLLSNDAPQPRCARGLRYKKNCKMQLTLDSGKHRSRGRWNHSRGKRNLCLFVTLLKLFNWGRRFHKEALQMNKCFTKSCTIMKFQFHHTFVLIRPNRALMCVLVASQSSCSLSV